MAAFPSLVNEETVQKIDTEWRLLHNINVWNEAGITPVKFWIAVRDLKTEDSDPVFSHVSSFMLNLLCLPHSSATVERVFSAVNRMKTKLRNKLSSATISGMLHTETFFITKYMLQCGATNIIIYANGKGYVQE